MLLNFVWVVVTFDVGLFARCCLYSLYLLGLLIDCVLLLLCLVVD